MSPIAGRLVRGRRNSEGGWHMFQDQNTRRRRSRAWIYYALLAVISLFIVPSAGPSVLVATVLCGLYATYLFRGGRVVVWIW
jgi:hypothetical protein